MAAAAAPAMLCYVTRPDAVLMEVEVEAKANGEDCLNQVRTRGQAGTLGRGASRRRRAPGRHHLPGARRRCGGGGGGWGWVACPRSPAGAPYSTGVGHVASPPGARGKPQRTRAVAGHPVPRPPRPSPALSRKKADQNICRRCVHEAAGRVPAGPPSDTCVPG